MTRWQPAFYSKTDFSIMLDGGFASQIYRLEADQDKMNELGNRILDDYQTSWEDPYRFKEDSFLITSIHLGENGTWLATTDSVGDTEQFEYHSHNVDTTENAVALQHLFGKWTETAEALLEGER